MKEMLNEIHRQAKGCKPYYVAMSQRICELCEAIKRFSEEGSSNHDQIKLWATEIQLINEMERILRRVEKEKVFVEDERGMLHEDQDT
jgi:hypothetical protein